MPNLVTINKKQITRNNGFRLKLGFSLIELMVVVSLFGLASSLITASYINFERNQRIKNTASRIKNDIRFAQNKATTGDKGPGGVDCDASSTTLGGWYFEIEAGQTSYTYGGDCVISASEISFGQLTVDLPQDTTISNIYYGSVSSVDYPIAIFFRPLTQGVTFHDARVALGATPDFFNSSGALINTITPAPSSPVYIEVSNLSGTTTKLIKIDLNGGISEEDP